MKHLSKIALTLSLGILFNCQNDDDSQAIPDNSPINTAVNFSYKSTINVGGEGASEISAFDATTNKLYVVNVETNQISNYTITNIESPVQETPIDVSVYGSPNSVAIYNGKLAVAVEAPIKQNPGKILVYNTLDNALLNEYTVGALPDMVTFSKDGKLLISANEGEPNDDFTIDPLGTISIIDLTTDQVTTLDFTAFDSQQASLETQGFRVFGPNATLAQDVEPEYITVSENSMFAWVSLQENNGMAKVNLATKTIEAIYPLGFKDYSLPENSFDASDKDLVTQLKNWNVKGMYQPDAIAYANINGTDYIFSANEGDSRDYDGFSEEVRVEDLNLDPTAYPLSGDFQNEINLGRLKTTTTLGDIDNDGDVDQIYSYGARSFSVWSASGNLLYDSGNSIATETLAFSSTLFNDEDNRSDDKGAEPESVEILNLGNQRYILFVGLERTDQIMVYDVTNPTSPQFLTILSHAGDEAPEGLLIIPASQSPTGKDLLVVSNEDSGTVSFYEN
jgi:hypothetical protein